MIVCAIQLLLLSSLCQLCYTLGVLIVITVSEGSHTICWRFGLAKSWVPASRLRVGLLPHTSRFHLDVKTGPYSPDRVSG